MPVCELDASGNVVAQTMFGAWGLVSRSTPSGTTWYAFDERGNVAQRVGGNGALLSTDLYDAFGNKRAGPADVFGFGGQAGYYTDAETGLILCTNRHYDPQSGRFLTRDPMGYGGGINLYSYTANNPVNRIDPSGLTYEGVVGGIIRYAGLLGDGFNNTLGGIASLGATSISFDSSNGVFNVSGSWFTSAMAPGAPAETLGNYVFNNTNTPMTPAAYNHELGHTDQATFLGTSFLPKYGVGALWGQLNGSSHQANPLEIDADRRSGNPNPYMGTLTEFCGVVITGGP